MTTTDGQTTFTPIEAGELLPQQPPFRFVDTLTGYTDHTASTSLTVRDTTLFVSDGHLNAPGLMENIAQTCAARIGYYNKYILGRGITVGLIGAVKGFHIESLPAVGERIDTEITITDEVFGMTLAIAVARVGEHTIAVADIKIALTDKETDQ